VLVVRRVLEFAGAPAVLDEITLPAALFRGLTRARLDAYRGSMYGLFETEFGVRMLKAREKLKAIDADADAAALLGVAPGRSAARGRARDDDLRRAAGRAAPRALRDGALPLPERARVVRRRRPARGPAAAFC
jgi:hypothetical protein